MPKGKERPAAIDDMAYRTDSVAADLGRIGDSFKEGLLYDRQATLDQARRSLDTLQGAMQALKKTVYDCNRPSQQIADENAGQQG